MEQNLLALTIHIRTTRRRQSIIARHKQRTTLRPRALDIRCCREADIVLAAAVAVAAEEQEVRAIASARNAGRLDKWTVCVVAVQDLNWVALQRDAVSSNGLQHDGRGYDGCDTVAAVATVADGVTVDLVHNVLRSVVVDEVGWVNGTALAERAHQRLVGEGSEGAFRAVGDCVADAVETGSCFIAGLLSMHGSVVENEFAIVL